MSIAKLTERLDAYAAKMDAYAAKMELLEAEVKTLRSMTPLEAFTAGLKGATPEQAAEWFAQCQELAAVLAPASASASEAKEAKTKGKDKKAVTNATGPTEWNVFVQATWQSMAAEKGVLYEDFEGDQATKDKAFKEASKKVGVTYQAAMKEASLRKAAAEGRDPDAPKVKKAKEPKEDSSYAELKAKVVARLAEKKAKDLASAAASAPAPAPAPAPAAAEEAEEAEEAVEDPLAKARADALEGGLVELEIEGEMRWYDAANKSVHNFPQLEPIGEYDAETKAYQPYF